MTEAKAWVPLHPKLDISGDGFRLLAETVDALAAVEWSTPEAAEAIRRIRQESLTQIRAVYAQGDAPGTGEREEVAALRVCVAVVCDLRGQGWRFRVAEGALHACRPEADHGTPAEAKVRMRSGLLLERDQVLRESPTRQFVERMERRRMNARGEWVSIFSLMRDGEELARQLALAAAQSRGEARDAILGSVIRPYLQVVDDGVCAHTGLALKDVWRYFRLTWVNAPKTVPGRNIWFLVRDAAAEHHPVIGIAALGSAIVQLTARDRWIGWHGDALLERLAQDPSDRWAEWVEHSLSGQVDGLYLEDFLDEGLLVRADLGAPSSPVIERLLKIATEAQQQHQLYPKSAEHKASAKSDAAWQEKARTCLFRYKRAITLASLLEARFHLLRAGFHSPTASNLARALDDREGRAAIKGILRRVKASHVGIEVMDITICGAVQPYNAILGGKLVSLLMASPQVAVAYRERYADASSIIASSMAGRAVHRTPQLVLLGTTSLYGGLESIQSIADAGDCGGRQ